MLQHTTDMEKFKELFRKDGKELIGQYHQDWLKQPEQMGSSIMKTKVINDPSRCTFHQLIVLAEFFGQSPYDIMIEYNLGKKGMSDREREVVEQFLQQWIPSGKKYGLSSPAILTGV